jgi:hypothetical protein
MRPIAIIAERILADSSKRIVQPRPKRKMAHFCKGSALKIATALIPTSTG